MKIAIRLMSLLVIASSLIACSSKKSSPAVKPQPTTSRGDSPGDQTTSPDDGAIIVGARGQGYQDGIDYPSWMVFGATTYELESNNSDYWSLIKKHQLTSIKSLKFNRPVELVSKSGANRNTNDYSGWLFIGGGRTQANTNTDSFGEGKNKDLSLILPTAQAGDSTLRYPFTPFCRISAWTSDDQVRSLPTFKIADANVAIEIYRMEAFRIQDKQGREVVVFQGKGRCGNRVIRSNALVSFRDAVYPFSSV